MVKTRFCGIHLKHFELATREKDICKGHASLLNISKFLTFLQAILLYREQEINAGMVLGKLLNMPLVSKSP